MTKEKDNRRSFRIIESTLVQYEVIDEADFEKGLDRTRMVLGTANGIRSKALDLDSRLGELFYHVRNDSPIICDAIELLNEKLNMVMQSLPEFRQSRDALTNQPAQSCELSAEGMVFGTNELLHPRAKLILRFLLISDNRFFETFCRVVRVVDKGEDDEERYDYRVAVEFDGMSRAEREILIQHLFSKESETLRLRRIQSEPAV